MILPELKKQIEIYEIHLSNLEWHLKTNSDLLGDREIIEQRIIDKKQIIHDLNIIYSKELDRIEKYNNGWVKIEDHLPVESGEYLVCYNDLFLKTVSEKDHVYGCINNGYFDIKEGYFTTINWGSITDDYFKKVVTHWKPIQEKIKPKF